MEEDRRTCSGGPSGPSTAKGGKRTLQVLHLSDLINVPPVGALLAVSNVSAFSPRLRLRLVSPAASSSSAAAAAAAAAFRWRPPAPRAPPPPQG